MKSLEEALATAETNRQIGSLHLGECLCFSCTNAAAVIILADEVIRLREELAELRGESPTAS